MKIRYYLFFARLGHWNMRRLNNRVKRIQKREEKLLKFVDEMLDKAAKEIYK